MQVTSAREVASFPLGESQFFFSLMYCTWKKERMLPISIFYSLLSQTVDL